MSRLTKAIEKAEKKLAALEAAHAKCGQAIEETRKALAELRALDVPPGGGVTAEASKGRKKAAK